MYATFEINDNDLLNKGVIYNNIQSLSWMSKSINQIVIIFVSPFLKSDLD